MKAEKDLSIMSTDELIKVILDLQESNRKLQESNREFQESNREFQETIRLLKDELARSKKISPTPNIGPSTLGQEKEQRIQKRGCPKKSKSLVPDDVIDLDVENLPVGSIFKGYQNYLVQDLKIEKKVTLYRRKTFELPDGTYKTADLPVGVKGHYGNSVKQYITYQSYHNNVSQSKIKQHLQDLGLDISEGQVHNIIIESAEVFKQEYEEIGQAGMATARELRVDDTGARHKGQNACCLVVQNDLFTYFKTSMSKSRMQFLKILRGNHTDYILNDIALDYMEQYKPSKMLRCALSNLKNINFADKDAWDKALIKADVTPEKVGHQLLLHLEEAGILGSAVEHGIAPNTVLLSDGAPQYHLFLHAACWIHAERAIKKIVPNNDAEAEVIIKVRSEIWEFYKQLQEYKKNPNDNDKQMIEKRFDEIFAQIVQGEKLILALQKFRANKTDLLRVLDYPFIDLHNNSSEQAVRAIVIKNNISGQTHSDRGQYVRDLFVSLIKTCRKHGISVWEYFLDRINKTNKIPYLPDLIRQKAQLVSIAPP